MPADGGTPQNYGSYDITSATLILIPQLNAKPVNGSSVSLVEPPAEAIAGSPAAAPPKAGAKNKFNAPPFAVSKKQKTTNVISAPPPPAPPPISGVGIMDVGQGNCNMLIAQTGNIWAYYDVGYPLWFYISSLPGNMRFAAPGYQGPIVQSNIANNPLQIYLSHWDWDHWRLGGLDPGLQLLDFTFPNQPIGPTAANFLAGLPNARKHMINAGTPPFAGPGNSALYCCFPPGPNVPIAMIINNTGLAMSVPTRLPAINTTLHDIVLTGDANFNSVPLPANVTANIAGITAVHHGSDNHGAADNLVGPINALGNQGYIAYSYGITTGGNHAYGFPVPAAVAKYQAANWSYARSTAEGANINVGPTAHGNIQMGAAVVIAQAGTAFSTLTYQMN